MKSVYIPRSINYPEQSYIGSASDLGQRLMYHSSGQCPHTFIGSRSLHFTASVNPNVSTKDD